MNNCTHAWANDTGGPNDDTVQRCTKCGMYKPDQTNHDEDNQTLSRECYHAAVEALTLEHIEHLKRDWKDNLNEGRPVDVYEYLLHTIDFDQLCRDVAERINTLTAPYPDLIGPVV